MAGGQIWWETNSFLAKTPTYLIAHGRNEPQLTSPLDFLPGAIAEDLPCPPATWDLSWRVEDQLSWGGGLTLGSHG